MSNISRFCDLVGIVNALNAKLDLERVNFYSGGHTFEECHNSDLRELEAAENELKKLLQSIVYE